jgi:hypothetical protein
LPFPFGEDVTPIHGTLLTAVQLQPVGAVTAAVRGPPAKVADSDVGDTAKLQAVPAWETVTV